VTDVELVTDVTDLVVVGVDVLVTVSVLVGAVTIWVRVLVVSGGVAAPDWVLVIATSIAVAGVAAAVAALTCATAPLSGCVAWCAALDAAALAVPDPHPLSGAKAIPSASTMRTSDVCGAGDLRVQRVAFRREFSRHFLEKPLQDDAAIIPLAVGRQFSAADRRWAHRRRVR
jgi:hypothetical protein